MVSGYQELKFTNHRTCLQARVPESPPSPSELLCLQLHSKPSGFSFYKNTSDSERPRVQNGAGFLTVSILKFHVTLGGDLHGFRFPEHPAELIVSVPRLTFTKHSPLQASGRQLLLLSAPPLAVWIHSGFSKCSSASEKQRD